MVLPLVEAFSINPRVSFPLSDAFLSCQTGVCILSHWYTSLGAASAYEN